MAFIYNLHRWPCFEVPRDFLGDFRMPSVPDDLQYTHSNIITSYERLVTYYSIA